MAQHIHRLQRDLRELLSHDFDTHASNVIVQTNQIVTETFTNITQLSICIRDGPYAEAHYTFTIQVPENFPFKGPKIQSMVPIWHPNIELTTGVVTLPLEWSPDLRLVDVALNLQMLMLSPSNFGVVNIEASIACHQDPKLFAEQIRSTLRGGVFAGLEFPPIVARCSQCKMPSNEPRRSSSGSSAAPSSSTAGGRKKRHNVDSSDDIEDILSVTSLSATAPRTRRKLNTTEEESSREATDALSGPAILSTESWDAYNIQSMLSQDEDDYLDDDSSPWSSREGGSSPKYTVSYRTYSAKSAERSLSSSDLPILQHLQTMTKQIARTTSMDEWDSGAAVRVRPKVDKDSIFRRSSVFALNETAGGSQDPNNMSLS